jgi:Arc/MetJ family transcription regulator
MGKTRINIEIDDTCLRTIMDRYGIRTKTEAVDLALRHLAGQPMTREEALAMRGAHAIGNAPVVAGARAGEREADLHRAVAKTRRPRTARFDQGRRPTCD